MKNSGQCAKCGGRRLLQIDEMRVYGAESARDTLHLCLWPGGSRAAGQLQLIACCKCGYAEWYAYDFGGVMEDLGALYPGVRVVDGDFTDAVRSLGLMETAGASFAGWKFLAQGTHQDVPMTIGERLHKRITDHGVRDVMRIEIRVTAKASLGNFAIRHPRATGLTPNVGYRQVVRTGDPQFDAAFMVVHLEPLPPHIAALAARSDMPVIPIPWLDSTARAKLVASSPEEVFAIGSEVGIVFREYGHDSFAHVVDLAVQLARWRGESEHPYR